MRGKGEKFIAAVCLSMCLLAACGKKDKVELPNVGILTQEEGEGVIVSTSEGGNRRVVTLTPATGYEAPVVTEEKAGKRRHEKPEVLKAEKEAAGLTQTAIEACMREQKGRYMYDMMDERLHTLYAEILLIIRAHAEDILVSAKNADDLQVAFMCVFQDHPEIFWIEGYSYGYYSQAGKISDFFFSGKYSYEKKECEKLQQKVDAWVSDCLASAPLTSDDYRKVKYVYQYIIQNTDYVIGAPDNQNILSVMLRGESVCQGYAKAMQYVLNEMDIPCALVVGKVNGDEGHAWNLVSIDGAYYYVDPTWGDAGYMSASGVDISRQGEINYNYLNVTTEEILRSHTLDNVVAMPHCVATKDNYYVREGAFFDSYDPDRIMELIDMAVYTGSRCVSFKCAGDEVYKECIRQLLEEQQIFYLLPERVESVDYTSNDDLKVLSFWF